MAGDAAADLPFMQARTEVEAHLAFEWTAYHRLNRDRPVGFGAAPLPWSSIDRYAQRYGIEGDAFERFTKLMQAMDAAFLAKVAELKTDT